MLSLLILSAGILCTAHSHAERTTRMRGFLSSSIPRGRASVLKPEGDIQMQSFILKVGIIPTEFQSGRKSVEEVIGRQI